MLQDRLAQSVYDRPYTEISVTLLY